MPPLRHRVTVRPLRVYAWNDELECQTVRIVGYRAACSCGYRGRVVPTISSARPDVLRHRLASRHATP